MTEQGEKGKRAHELRLTIGSPTGELGQRLEPQGGFSVVSPKGARR
jgi:hypothetical protein